MVRVMKVRLPTTAEIQQLSKGILKLADPHQRRRAEALTLYGMRLNPLEIASAQGAHPNTVYTDLHAFEQSGLEAVAQLRKSGAPGHITVKQETEIAQLAEQTPQTAGVPYGRWSLRKLSVHLVKQHIVKSIGRERLRQVLKNGVYFRRVQCKLVNQDPQRPAILARLRWIFRHLPTAGHLAFFDVKPIAVKAYGGRRYTSTKHLILARNPKTHGRFYLFVSYDAVSSWVH